MYCLCAAEITETGSEIMLSIALFTKSFDVGVRVQYLDIASSHLDIASSHLDIALSHPCSVFIATQ